MPGPAPSTVRGDVVGGLVSAGVAIPLAMGYGMFAFVSFGDEYFVNGALAGLLTALIVGVGNVLLGDKSANLYAPRVTTTFFLGILLAGLVHSDLAVVRSGGLPLTLAIILSIILLGGVFQLLFGLIRLGTLIKFTPHPVMAGFQNAAAILLFLVQLGNVLGFDHNVPFVHALQHLDEAKPASVGIAVIVFAVMWRAKSLLPRVPPVLVGLALGTILYYVLVLAGLGAHVGPVIGSAPSSPELARSVFPRFAELARHPGLSEVVPTIIGGALALALIASIDALLCARLLARPGDPRIDGDRLLARLGAGNALAACLGGITSGLNLGPSLANKVFGGHTPFSALVNAAVILLAATVFFPVVVHLPRVALSAVIMVIAVQHIDGWTVQAVRRLASGSTPHRRHLLLELSVAAVVAALSVTVNIVLAVLIGVGIAVLLFAVRMSRSIVRRGYYGNAVRSRKSRTPGEMAVLDRAGAAIVVLELQGALFFGTAETLAGEIADRAPEARCVVLDLRRVTEIDSTGGEVLRQIEADLAARGVRLVIAVAQPSQSAAILADTGVLDAVTPARVFRHVDPALEWSEEQLLEGEAAAIADGREALARAGVFAGMTPSELAQIEKRMTRAAFTRGSAVFRAGDAGRSLFVIANGVASAYLGDAGRPDIRLTTFAPGTVFGELAILDPGPRSATVIADDDLVCRELTGEAFDALCREAPAVAIKLLTRLGRELSRRLRQANRTIQQLEE